MRRSLFPFIDNFEDSPRPIPVVHRAAIDDAELADQLGYTSYWIPEHHFVPGVATTPNPAVLLAAIAQRTTNLRVGPAVSILPLHDPIQVAEDYSMVDIVSNGRLNLGVGSGSAEREFGRFGVDFEHRRETYATRLAALREHLTSAATGRRADGDLNVTPVQQPHPPFYVSTMEPERARRVGRDGDSAITLIAPDSPDLSVITDRVEAHREGLREGGHDPDSAEMVAAAYAVVADTEEAAKKAALPSMQRILKASGLETDVADVYHHMQDAGIALFGDPERASANLDRIADSGVEHIALIYRFGAMSDHDARRTLELLAP